MIRQQARDAARNVRFNVVGSARPRSEIADAVSDVWEPLVREALEWIEGLDLGLNWDGPGAHRQQDQGGAR